MSAIAGIWHRDGRPATAEELQPALDAMKHRGPLHCGNYIEGGLALGCRLSRTTPESANETAPLRQPAARRVIVADARIDNRAELIAELRIDGPSRDIADSAVILAAYERWGRDCPAELLGDFAFAIWDETRRELFCARDPFGLRPFVYWLTDTHFVFASELPGLLALDSVPRRVDDTRILEYLVGYYDNTDSTFYRDIQRLPPAHSLIVRPDQAALHRYWSLDPSRDLRLGSDSEYAEAYRSLFEDAVKRRLRSTGLVGSMLSGGLDSTSIACVARDMLRAEGTAPLQTFSTIFDDVPKSDERDYMHAAIAQGGMEPHWVNGDRIGPLLDIEHVLDHVGEPFLGPNLFLHYALCRAASDAGVVVLLDGFDGDTTVSHGTTRITELVSAGRWPTAFGEARDVARRLDLPLTTLIRQLMIAPFVPASLRAARDRLRRRPPGAEAILNPEFRKRSGFDERAAELLGWYEKPLRWEKQEHLRRLNRGLMARLLEVGASVSSAFSLDVRYPFFDRRLIEFCFSLPTDQKLHRGWTRWIARRAMEGILPPGVQWRDGKSDLSHNFAHTLHKIDHARVLEIVETGSGLLSEYVDLSVLRMRLDRFAAQKNAADGQVAFQAALLCLWLRRTG